MKDLKEKEFLDEIAGLRVDLQNEIEAKQAKLDMSPEARAARRRRVLKDGDYDFFAYTYFPHHIWGEHSQFQEHFCSTFPKLLRKKSGNRSWWVAPRGEAKSTLLTKIGPVWITVQGLLQDAAIRDEIDWQEELPPFLDYVVFLGAELRMPTKLMEAVKMELTINNMLAMDFPEICGKTSKWKIGEFVTKNGVKMEPFGADQAIRGTFHFASRPKVLLGDDLITDKEAKSPTERENRWNWLEKSVDYLGPPDGTVKYLGVGTILNKDDPISRAKKTIGHTVHHFKAIETLPFHMEHWEECETLMRNDDRRVELAMQKKGQEPETEDLPSYKYYLKHKKKMNKGAVTSWPSVRSLFWLMRQRAKNKRAFGTEMQGDARADEDKVFIGYQFWVQRLQHWIMFGACDPSMGKGETSDPSAILVGGWDTKLKKLHVIEAAIKRRVPSKIVADIIKAQKEYGCQGWAFENNNAYEYMRKSFIEKGKDKNIVLPLVGITATVPQEVRVDSLEPNITDMDPDILFHSRLLRLIEEMDDWPEKQPHHHYDGLVALHLLYHMAVTRAGGLPNITTRGRKDSVNTSRY